MFLAMATPAAAAPLPGAVTIAPGTQIQAVVDQNPPGTTYLLAAGLHRMQQVMPKDADRFIGAPGARMNGAQVVSRFREVDGVFVAEGVRPHPGMVRYGVCAKEHPLCDRPLALFLGERLLHPAARPQELAPGRWYLDEARATLWLADNPAGQAVELTHTPYAFGGTARGVEIRNLVVERYASSNQRGAINDSGRGTDWTIAGNQVRWNYGYGITLGAHGRAIGNNVHHNGQLGIGGGTASGMLVEGNVIAFNAWNGTDCEWECGGAKWGAVASLVVRANHVHDNAGIGLWSDEGCRDVLIEGNTVENNDRAGISHEIGGTAVIRHNTLRANGSARFVWGWHGQIQVQNSSHTLVHDNRLELHPQRGGNGIMLLQQDRGPGSAVRNVLVLNNTIVMPHARGVAAGWFADFAAAGFPSAGNRFDGNRYIVPRSQLGARLWSVNGEVDFASWRHSGGDETGTLQPASP